MDLRCFFSERERICEIMEGVGGCTVLFGRGVVVNDDEVPVEELRL